MNTILENIEILAKSVLGLCEYLRSDGADLYTVYLMTEDSNMLQNQVKELYVKLSDTVPLISEKTLDFSREYATISSKEISQDGAPRFNKNAAGPHKKSHLSKADKEKYSKRIVGQKTSDGITVTKFSNHAYDRIAQRNISMGQIEKLLQSSNIVPDKTYPDRNCYDIPGKRLVLNKNTGEIVTIEWRRQNK